ncbi:MAG TPA: hypothetical protein PK252_06725 [Bacteroidales bacterium]|nr:hypothetical protein [Bacteroidales bacterium]
MKTITKQITVLAVFGLISASAYSQANSYSVNSETLYRHGYNSGGANVQENTDSVTTGGTTRYWVYPDLSLNPGYDVNNPLTTPLTSAFNWTTSGATGTATGTIAAVGAYGTYTNYKQVTWGGTGTINLNATETSGAGCVGGTAVTTPIAVIAAPDVTAIAFSALPCPTGTIPYTQAGPTATLTITCPVNGNKEVSVNWSLSCSNAGWNGGVAMTGTAVLGNGNTIDLSGVNLSHPGTYTLTIVNITDRIATKSGLTAIPDGTSNTFVLLPTPVTGPMYHVPNQ